MRAPTPEILAAAERLRRIDNGESSYHVYGYDQNPTLYGETVDDCEALDRFILADAYLRLLPPNFSRKCGG